MIDTNLARRGFLRGLAGILAAGVAPAFIGSKILMPVRSLVAAPLIPEGLTVTSEESSGVVTATYRVFIKWAEMDENGNPIDMERLPPKGKWYKQDGSEILVTHT